MAIEPNDAATFLTDVAAVETRTRQAVRQGVTGHFLILWGVLTAIGNLVTQFLPAYSIYGWVAVMAAGIAGSFAILVVRSRRRRRPSDMRILYALLTFLVFGNLWIALIGGMDHRQLEIFMPMLIMMGFIVAGYWMGRFFVYCGVLVTLAIVAGFFWAGEWLPLWMAILHGGSMITAGLYLRRVAVTP